MPFLAGAASEPASRPPKDQLPAIAGMYVPGDSDLGHMRVQVLRDTNPGMRWSPQTRQRFRMPLLLGPRVEVELE
jgi:hypothetical protein